ncbi:uncharacterized protein LOC134276975 [Saccostrea cucullata]|uniref:uncharacterized protein LOC134276975 n=1 Tax=Saccostrea cuccullata TaxID=36930 RepID=UPI002ED1107E
MATSTTAQDMMRCDICKNNEVQMHCDACLVNLCKLCVGEHFSKDLSKTHKIVDYKDKKSTPIFPQCASHSDSLCECFCKDCNIPLCLKCVISTDIHRNHNLSIISDILRFRKDAINKDFEELKETIIPTYQFIKSSVQLRLKQIELIYDNIKKDITKHGQDWHKEVDKCVNKLSSSVQEMKTKHINLLKEHQDDVNKRLGTIQDSVQQCKNLMESNDISLCLNYTSLNEEYRQLPQKPVGDIPVFTPLQITPSKFLDMFGNLTSLTFRKEKQGYSMKTEYSLPILKHLTEKPDFRASKIQIIDKSDEGISQDRSKKILISSRDKMQILEFDQVSLVKSITTETPNRVTDISVTNNGKLAYIVYNYDNKNISVNKMNESMENICLENWRYCDMYINSSGDLLVIMECYEEKQVKVVKYPYSNMYVKQTVQFDNENKPLYSSGICKCISENRNFDICVADFEAGAVVVVDQAGKLRFRYTGNALWNSPCKPKGISTDSQGYILTLDWKNSCIHIIDQDGQFLGYFELSFRKSYPLAMCTDGDDMFLAVGDRRSKNPSIYECKYLQEL